MKTKLEYKFCPECDLIVEIKGRYRKMVRDSLPNNFLCLDMGHAMQDTVPKVTPLVEICKNIRKHNA